MGVERFDTGDVPSFSAVVYFFGRELHKQLKVPMGLIHTSWGGTPARRGRARACSVEPGLESILVDWRRNLLNWPLPTLEVRGVGDGGRKQRPRQQPAARPQAPQGPGHAWTPAGLYNGMIAPLVPVRHPRRDLVPGRVERRPRAISTGTRSRAMIATGAAHWGQGDFPFLFVQLANFMARHDEPGESAWAELREAQRDDADAPNTGMAVTIDIGEANDIHPKNKQDVGPAAGAVRRGA